MTTYGFDRPQPSREPEGLTAADLVSRVNQFDGPPEQFLQHLLKMQCQIASTLGGAILRAVADGRYDVVAVYPPPQKGATSPVWLAQAVESAQDVLSKGKTTVKPLHGPDELYGQQARRHLVMVPIQGTDGIRGVAAFLVETVDAEVLAVTCERLELTMSLLSLYEMRLMLQRRGFDLNRLRQAMETLAALNEQDRFKGCAMAFCNEVAARWKCERVGIGFLKGRYVQLKAMSHTEKFSSKMKLVQETEAAMEECLDQDVEVLYPSEPEATYVSRAAGELSKHHGPSAVLSLPLRRAGEPVAVLTIERPADNPFAAAEVESLRLACELCTPRLVNLHEHDRWFGARAVADVRKGLAILVGPKHTWAKLATVLITAALIFLIFARGEYRADAPFMVEATQRRVIPAPFDGFLKTVEVEPGDLVKAGETLATLNTAELILELTAARAECRAYAKQHAAAMRDGKTVEAQIARAQTDKVTAKIELLAERIKRANIVSPITGSVVTGDLKRQIGAPVKTGDALFEVAPLGSLRATLSMSEDQIGEVRDDRDQVGELATAAYPDRRIAFTVERINPVAEVVKERNVFKVRVVLAETPSWMRPGMEGVAKVSIDRRLYVRIWTRKLVNWLRMKLWW